MIGFILNNQLVETGLPIGTTLLDFIRYNQNLKGTKIGCREGDCGACTVLIGELTSDEEVRYRSMTSCLMPLGNASGKHVVTVEGINPADGEITPVQKALVDNSGSQCGFCTVGFVMSMTGFCIDETENSPEMAVSAIDGNICRCTGYKSIERVAFSLLGSASGEGAEEKNGTIEDAIQKGFVPEYFSKIKNRLKSLAEDEFAMRTQNVELKTPNPTLVVGGGTDLYVQKHDEMVYADAAHILYDDELRKIELASDNFEIGASVTVSDLLDSSIMQASFPNLRKHLKLVSSTPIRNMATLAGNFVNASPIGDMTVWFLALDADIELETMPVEGGNSIASESAKDRNPTVMKGADGVGRNPTVMKGTIRTLPLKDLYLGYKDLAKSEDEVITKTRFSKPSNEDFRFNFEKVSKRRYLDIATVNTAISIRSESPALEGGFHKITDAHVAVGGVSPIPLYLCKTSAYLNGKEISQNTVLEANEILQTEISPISDVRGSAEYKRLLLRQLFAAHFAELFGIESPF